MKLIVEKTPDLQSLYEKMLRLLLSAEEMTAVKLSFLVDSATDPELRQALAEQEQQTEAHAARLKDILGRTTDEADPLKCKVIYALFDEADDLLKGASQEGVRNALIITAAQRIEHYKIAAYGAVRQYARVLGCDDDARILDKTMQEEKQSDRQLTSMAERINPAAKKAA